ncbi:MAG: VanW family protein [Clostridia bacterium]|nr:VanW family protein [Clostridia bacterium]
MEKKLFCERGPLCYAISVRKEILKRSLKDLVSRDRIAGEHREEKLPNLAIRHSSVLLRRLEGVDMTLQENKAKNIGLACRKVNGIVIRPGETFSFWKTIGSTTKRKGYREGLIISRGKVSSGIGGGMCQMGNLIHWMVLNSPLTVTELHHHSDALFPDDRRRVPFGTGTSVQYNYLDYRFRNDTDQTVQILVWIGDGELCGELRSERAFPCCYRLVEENHHFRREGEDYYRISQVYRVVTDRATGEETAKELILDNHSRVLYDHALIPREAIRED